LYSVNDATTLPMQCTPGASAFAHPEWLCCVFANFDIRDGYSGQQELFRSLLARIIHDGS
jgi:hypothetical protein